ncbi:CPBP family intramembrane glutamic endopeptidase [Mycolicibacterium xanthum]|uniref:CPBP family intramembrane glutamic endopeptidase n=1 Tax=Mycolicibacterium xanthum TaxID=2796469 RepID=UPI0027E0996B|nr:CPBP family intramembrane glutamic endopeptidase [Mycolicibacterium xanthum]
MDANLDRRHRWGLGAFLVVESVYLLLALALAYAFAGRAVERVLAVVLGTAGPTVVAALVAVLITTLRGNGPTVDLSLRWSWRAAGVGLLFGIGGLFVTIPAAALWVSVVGEDANSAAGEVFGDIRSTWAWAIVVFLVVVVVAPICEEIVYRGLLWGAVDQRWGRWVALIVTTVVFSVAHLEWTRIPLLLVVAIPIGLARLLTANLPASMIAHMVTNLLPGLVLMFTVAGAVPA